MMSMRMLEVVCALAPVSKTPSAGLPGAYATATLCPTA